jgi:hypothetical protein
MPGELAPLARALSDEFRVIQLCERRSGEAPLTVARHLADFGEAWRRI